MLKDDKMHPRGSGTSKKLPFREFHSMLSGIGVDDRDPLEELREAFKALDKEQTGRITSGNLKMLLADVFPDVTDQEIQEMMSEVDPDGFGELTFDQFRTAMT